MIRIKQLLFLLAFLSQYPLCAQIKWRYDSIPFDEIEWNNMSTSYISNPDKLIALVTAIPYNGINEVSDNKALDLYFTSSYYRYQSNLNNSLQKLDTYDSGNVYFLTPGIFKSNANDFEYRILKDGDSVLKNWSLVTQFTDSNFQLNSFQKYCGFLGGYRATWNHFLTVQLRRKNNARNIAESSVYWKEIHPRISAIFTSEDMNAFLRRLKNSYSTTEEQNKQRHYREIYDSGEDSLHHRRKTLVFAAGENSIVFYLNANVYSKEAIEYSLVKNGKTVVGWRPNDFDNDFIWLHNLSNGDYVLQMRFSKQRHNVSAYPFRIEAFWYQTSLFHFAAGCVTGLLLVFLIYFFINRRKLRRERSIREKLQLEQRAVRSQLNPHFTFNALSSIQSLMNQSRVEEANHYFTEFSSLLRDSLRNNEKERLPLHEELQTLERYIQLEQLRFSFSYAISISKDINTSTVDVPSLLLQPLVENAIKHGISGLQDKGKLSVVISCEERNMMIRIQDNGSGFIQKEGSGYGLPLTKERIRLLNRSLKEQSIQMTIDNGGKGTSVLLLFINWL